MIKVGRFCGERQLESEHVERRVEDLLELELELARFVAVWLDGSMSAYSAGLPSTFLQKERAQWVSIVW